MSCATPTASERLSTITQSVPGALGDDKHFPDPWKKDPWNPSLRNSSRSSYPVFEWELQEESEDKQLTSQQQAALESLRQDYNGAVRPIYRTSTRLPSGEEGLLVDCGAVDNLTGLNFILRQAAAAKTHDLPTDRQRTKP